MFCGLQKTIIIKVNIFSFYKCIILEGGIQKTYIRNNSEKIFCGKH